MGMDDVELMLPKESGEGRQQKRIGHRREPFPKCMERDTALFQLLDKRSPRPVEQQDLHIVAIGMMTPRQLRHQPLSAAGPKGCDDVEDLHVESKQVFGNLFSYAGLVCQRR